MLRTWDLTGANWPTGIKRRLEVPRSRIDVDSVMAATKEIIEQVRVGTQETVLSLSEKFDGIRPQSLRVPQEVIDQAVADSTEDFRAALLEAASRVRAVSKAQ
ncbi:MAG: histidinol dehydrogenase, partial [Candidatus Nanopelagicales bacterium]